MALKNIRAKLSRPSALEQFRMRKAEETARRLEAEAEVLRWAALSPRERALETRTTARQARAQADAQRQRLTIAGSERLGAAPMAADTADAGTDQRRAAIFALASEALAGEVQLDVKGAFESSKTIAQIAEDVQQMVFERRVATLHGLRTFAQKHGVKIDMALASDRTMSLEAIREHVTDAMAAHSESMTISNYSPHPSHAEAIRSDGWSRSLDRVAERHGWKKTATGYGH